MASRSDVELRPGCIPDAMCCLDGGRSLAVGSGSGRDSAEGAAQLCGMAARRGSKLTAPPSIAKDRSIFPSQNAVGERFLKIQIGRPRFVTAVGWAARGLALFRAAGLRRATGLSRIGVARCLHSGHHRDGHACPAYFRLPVPRCPSVWRRRHLAGPDSPWSHGSLPRRSVSCYAKPGRFTTAAMEDKV
jgi:hypothetical protein